MEFRNFENFFYRSFSKLICEWCPMTIDMAIVRNSRKNFQVQILQKRRGKKQSNSNLRPASVSLRGKRMGRICYLYICNKCTSKNKKNSENGKLKTWIDMPAESAIPSLRPSWCCSITFNVNAGRQLDSLEEFADKVKLLYHLMYRTENWI